MALIVDNSFVRQVAFEWGSTVRVYEMDDMEVIPIEDFREYTLANGKRVTQLIHLWLQFKLTFRYAKRISPSGSSGNDLIDAINTLHSTTQFKIHPIYNLDASVNYVVVKTGQSGSLVTVDRFKNIPTFTFTVITQSSLSSYPGWLRNARKK